MITTSVIKQLIKEKKYVPELLINNKYNKKHNKKHNNIKTEEILGLFLRFRFIGEHYFMAG